jgi:hypothetical protein
MFWGDKTALRVSRCYHKLVAKLRQILLPTKYLVTNSPILGFILLFLHKKQA